MSYSLRSTTSTAFQLTALSLALVLAGCGGGGTDTVAPEPDTGVQQPGTGTPGNGGNPSIPNSEANEIYISSDKSQLLTGRDTTSIDIRVIDKNGGIVAGVPVTLSIADAASTGLSLSGNSRQVTDEQGLITVELKQSIVGVDSQLNHQSVLTVQANDGSGIKQTFPIIVAGTRAENVISTKNSLDTADNFTISGQILDGSSQSIANSNVVLYANDLEVGKGKTDINGNFLFDLNSANLKVLDEAYLFSIEVKGVKLNQRIPDILSIGSSQSSNIGFSPTTDIIVNSKRKVVLNIPDASNGDSVFISTNKGKIFASNTDTEGSSRRKFIILNKEVTFYAESNVPGTATIRAEYGNDSKETILNFVSVQPTKLILQIERSVLGTGGSTLVIARVLDKNDAPVKNAVVQFTTIRDSSGGSLSKGVAYSDNNGRAVVNYNAGQNPTSTNGVVIEAQIRSIKLPDGTEENINTLIDEAAVTVQTKSTFISFAFSDKVSTDDREVYYFQNGSISVLNSSGKPARNQPVSINLIPHSYDKGFYFIDYDRAGTVFWNRNEITCGSEDKNNNGILDSNLNEDFNNNGQLDPINVTAIVRNNGQIVDSNQDFNFITDDSGKVDFSIRYPKQYANWYKAKITVNTRVDGSESQQSRVVGFPELIDDVNISSRPPLRPNFNSPFGIDFSSCMNDD